MCLVAKLAAPIATAAPSLSGSSHSTVFGVVQHSLNDPPTEYAQDVELNESGRHIENIDILMEGNIMSQFREWEPLKKEDTFRVEDSMVIDKLLESKKLTDKQRDALRRLLASFNYIRD